MKKIFIIILFLISLRTYSQPKYITSYDSLPIMTPYTLLIGSIGDNYLRKISGQDISNYINVYFYSKGNVQTVGQASIAYQNITSPPWILNETDPVFIADSSNYIPKIKYQSDTSSNNKILTRNKADGLFPYKSSPAGSGSPYNNITYNSSGVITAGSNTAYLTVMNETLSSSASITTSYNIILCNSTSGNIIVTLPNATTCNNYIVTIKKIDASANTVIIQPVAAQLIDSQSSLIELYQSSTYTIMSNNTQWYIISAL